MDSKQIWTIIGISLVVAVVASIATLGLTGNVIRVPYSATGTDVYTKADIDLRTNILSKLISNLRSDIMYNKLFNVNLTGSGNAYVCTNTQGYLYRSSLPCVINSGVSGGGGGGGGGSSRTICAIPLKMDSTVYPSKTINFTDTLTGKKYGVILNSSNQGTLMFGGNPYIVTITGESGNTFATVKVEATKETYMKTTNTSSVIPTFLPQTIYREGYIMMWNLPGCTNYGAGKILILRQTGKSAAGYYDMINFMDEVTEEIYSVVITSTTGGSLTVGGNTYNVGFNLGPGISISKGSTGQIPIIGEYFLGDY